VGFYIDAFPHAYKKYGGIGAQFYGNLTAYKNTIQDNAPEIYRIVAAEINTYLNLYKVHANQSADEFKLIYYLAVGIERHLIRLGLVEIARIHKMTMIGLLDDKLKTIGIVKPRLTKAMINLIKLGKLEAELGPTGCYMIYKCVSTVEILKPPATA